MRWRRSWLRQDSLSYFSLRWSDGSAHRYKPQHFMTYWSYVHRGFFVCIQFSPRFTGIFCQCCQRRWDCSEEGNSILLGAVTTPILSMWQRCTSAWWWFPWHYSCCQLWQSSTSTHSLALSCQWWSCRLSWWFYRFCLRISLTSCWRGLCGSRTSYLEVLEWRVIWSWYLAKQTLAVVSTS